MLGGLLTLGLSICDVCQAGGATGENRGYSYIYIYSTLLSGRLSSHLSNVQSLDTNGSGAIVSGPNTFDSAIIQYIQNRVAKRHEIMTKFMAIPAVYDTSTNSSASGLYHSLRVSCEHGALAEAQQGHYIRSILSTISTVSIVSTARSRAFNGYCLSRLPLILASGSHQGSTHSSKRFLLV